jgi:hypothetical protein
MIAALCLFWRAHSDLGQKLVSNPLAIVMVLLNIFTLADFSRLQSLIKKAP